MTPERISIGIPPTHKLKHLEQVDLIAATADRLSEFKPIKNPDNLGIIISVHQDAILDEVLRRVHELLASGKPLNVSVAVAKQGLGSMIRRKPPAEPSAQ